MNEDEIRLLKLSRLEKEKIIKYGTYDMVRSREILQDHPFYENREHAGEVIKNVNRNPQFVMEDSREENGYEETPAAVAPEPIAEAEPPAEPESAPAPVEEEVDPEVLAAQIASSNFKVGMSQEEVDAMLSGLLG